MKHLSHNIANSPDSVVRGNDLIEMGSRRLSEGLPDHALALFMEAMEYQPSSAIPFFNAGVACHQLKELKKAIEYYQQALDRSPNLNIALYNIGIAHVQAGCPQEAIPFFTKAVENNPNYTEAAYNLGVAYEKAGDTESALAAYDLALQTDPGHAKALNNIGLIRMNRDEMETAIEHFEHAIAIYPQLADAHYNLGIALQSLGAHEKGRASFLNALKADEDYTPAKWLYRLSLPRIYNSTEQIESARGRFTDQLEALISSSPLDTERQKRLALKGVGATTNFFLQYQGRDDLDLQKRYGTFICDVMASNFPQWSIPRHHHPAKSNEKIHIGYITSFMYGHTVGDFLLGWLKHHSKDDFEIHCYHIGPQSDDLTQAIRGAADHFHHLPAKHVESAARQIATDNLDIVVYPEIGMCPRTIQLAALYLAPVQCASFWHPVTTGLPTIDYYLSGALHEPDDADRYYSEKLIRLPNLGLCYTPPALPSPPKSRFDFGIPTNRFIYLSSQMLYKYLPQDDDLYPKIASRVQEALFVFISDKHGGITERFKDRLQRAFSKYGLKSEDYCHFMPRLSHADFLSLHMAADVLLDTLEWSGGHTTLEALSCGLPVVTSPGRFLRGRTSYAMLKMMGVDETIGIDKDDYGKIAVRLALEPEFYAIIKSAICRNVHLLFNDHSFIKGLEEFYRSCGSCDRAGESSPKQADKASSPFTTLQDSSDFGKHWEAAIRSQKAGAFKSAIASFRLALQAAPGHAEATYNLALVYQQEGLTSEAISHYRDALKNKPNWPEALFNLASCLQTQKDDEGAKASYLKLLSIDPKHTQGAFRLGNLYLLQGDADQALKWLKFALSSAPELGVLHNNIGKAHLLKGDNEQALSAFQKAVKLSPDLAEAWFNLAEMDTQIGELLSAVAKYRKAIAIDPNMGAAHNNMGNALRDLKRYPEAIDAFQKVLDLDPDLPQGHYNLGGVFRLIEDFPSAVQHFSKAIQILPTYSDAWNNLALTCKNMGDFDRALLYFNRALQIDPDLAIARWNRSFVHFLQDNWKAGWTDFEIRFDLPQRRAIYPHRIRGRRWDGLPIPQKTLLVHDEQGLGDTFQFIRWLPWAKARCGRLVFETRPEIIPLIENTLGIDEIVERSPDKAPNMPFEAYIPLMSIPRLINLSPDRLTDWAPYIEAPEAKVAQWKSRLPDGKLRVGIVWAGRPEHGNDANRSSGIDALSPLFRNSSIQFVGLQKGPAEHQLDAFSFSNVTNLGSELNSFLDTAAILAQLDLLITVDTSVAHLAGAMGRPVWVMIPFIPDWRWGVHGHHTPWYPTMKLFRQTRPKDWNAVIEHIAAELGHLMERRP